MTEEIPTDFDWTAYYNVVADRPPRDLFRHTLHRFAQVDGVARFAIDMGCGAGNETSALLNSGWQVLAIDQQAAAVAKVRSLVKPEHQARISFHIGAFEDVELPPSDFIWAGASLPFSSPEGFPGLWERIVSALKPGGRFAGDFFGPRHAWATRKNMTFHSADQVKGLCRTLEIEYFIAEEGTKITATSGPQHWHAYAIVARRS